MKRIEDAPEEVQKVFWDFFEEEISNYECSYEVMAHIFLKGFDTAMATGGLLQRQKRTITNIIKLEGSFFAVSNDGKMFSLERNMNSERVWVPYPDLPQD